MGRRDILFLILFIIYLGLVAWCCFGHFESMPEVRRYILGIPTDKVVHFAMFLPFVILGYPACDFLATGHRRGIIILVLVFLAGLLVALATEKGQSLTSYRSGDPLDLAADVTGLATGAVIVIATLLIKKRVTNR